MHEAEDVVHKQQHVLLVHIAEVLSHGQSRETHAHACTGGLIHLAVAESHFRLRQVFGIDHAGILELLVEVVAFAGALTHTTEHGHSTVLFGDVVDEFLNQHGFAHTGTAEEADFSTLAIGSQEINHLDSGFENLGLGFKLGELGG